MVHCPLVENLFFLVYPPVVRLLLFIIFHYLSLYKRKVSQVKLHLDYFRLKEAFFTRSFGKGFNFTCKDYKLLVVVRLFDIIFFYLWEFYTHNCTILIATHRFGVLLGLYSHYFLLSFALAIQALLLIFQHVRIFLLNPVSSDTNWKNNQFSESEWIFESFIFLTNVGIKVRPTLSLVVVRTSSEAVGSSRGW